MEELRRIRAQIKACRGWEEPLPQSLIKEYRRVRRKYELRPSFEMLAKSKGVRREGSFLAVSLHGLRTGKQLAETGTHGKVDLPR